MKKIGVIILILVFLQSCDPPRDIYQTGTISIKAEVINPRTTITLGDSVAFFFEVPDTVLFNGKRIKVSAGNNDGGNNGFNVNKMDPSRSGGFTNAPTLNTCNLYASVGQITNSGVWSFLNQNGKLIGKYFMIPQQKGVYFFEQTQEGYVDLNNQSLKLRFSFNFGNINRNHQMLIDSAGPVNNFNLFLQDKISRGLEIYGFKVN